VSVFTGFDFTELMGIGKGGATVKLPPPPVAPGDPRNKFKTTGSSGILIEYRGPLKVDFLQWFERELKVDGKVIRRDKREMDNNKKADSVFYIAGFGGLSKSIGQNEHLSVMWDRPDTFSFLFGEVVPISAKLDDGKDHIVQLTDTYETYAVDMATLTPIFRIDWTGSSSVVYNKNLSEQDGIIEALMNERITLGGISSNIPSYVTDYLKAPPPPPPPP